ncbi:MAG: response regulator [Rheinheimera sp.]|nr:response regulator [Rheinheimera sp.]
MLKPKLLIALVIALLMAALSACWLQYQLHAKNQQLQLGRVAEHLSNHLIAEPDFAAELMTFARTNSPVALLSLELLDANGKQLVLVGDSVKTASRLAGNSKQQSPTVWHQSLSEGRLLVIRAADVPVSFIWVYGLLAVAFTLWLGSKFLQRRHQQFFEQIWQNIPESYRKQDPAETEINQLSLAIRQLVTHHDEASHQAALNLQIMQSQQKLHVDQQAEIRQQLTQSERRALQLSRALQCWQSLASQAPQLHHAELAHWLAMLNRKPQQPAEPNLALQGIPQWFAQAVRAIQPMWPAEILLLPDEDPDASRYQAEMDGQHMQQLLHSLLLAVKPLIDGKELLISYRLDSGARDKLQLKIQYTGKSLSARNRQVLAQGGLADPHWEDIPFEICRGLLQLLSAELQIQELADLGTRLDLSIRVSGQQPLLSRRFQNLVIYDPRPCRLALWRHSLLGVSEQVVATNSLAELKAALQSRLVDTVVVHWNSEVMTESEMAELQHISSRYQLILFAPESLQQRFGTQPSVNQFISPLLLADLQDLPQPGSQFSSQQLLIVDDNPTNLSFVRAMLSGQGISIDFATTGHEALKLASHSRYQLILMDIQLPDLSGIEVTKRIRQLRHHQQTVILAFTGHALPEEAVSFRLAGMDDVMTKPLDARKIAHIMSRIRPLAETQ